THARSGSCRARLARAASRPARCWPRRGRRGSPVRCRTRVPSRFLELHAREIVGEPPVQVDDAQRAAGLGGAADLLAEGGELVEAVDAREAADVPAEVADRGEVAGLHRLVHALEVAAPVLPETGPELLHRPPGAKQDPVSHPSLITPPAPGACARASRAARRPSPAWRCSRWRPALCCCRPRPPAPWQLPR